MLVFAFKFDYFLGVVLYLFIFLEILLWIISCEILDECIFPAKLRFPGTWSKVEVKCFVNLKSIVLSFSTYFLNFGSQLKLLHLITLRILFVFLVFLGGDNLIVISFLLEEEWWPYFGFEALVGRSWSWDGWKLCCKDFFPFLVKFKFRFIIYS